MEEKELFEDYEMQGWQLSPRICKILGIAVISNFLLIYAFGQINFFTARGCDTPYVGMVCQVLDSAYIASVFLGKDHEWASRAYTETEIGEDGDVDITYIDVSEKLEYPEGYFALANPPEQTSEVLPAADLTIDPTATNTGNSIGTSPSTPSSSDSSGSNSDLMSKAAVTPTPNKSVEDQEVPDKPFESADGKYAPSYKRPSARIPKREKIKQLPNESPTSLGGSGVKTNPAKPAIQKTPPPTPTPETTPTDAELQQAKDSFRINKAPFTRLADDMIANQEEKDPAKRINLKEKFQVVLNGTLTKEGKFDPSSTKYETAKLKGNPEMQNVAKKAIEAIGDSTILSYLQAVGVDKVNIAFVQDDKKITAVIRSNQPSEEHARTVSKGFGGFISLAKWNTKDDPDTQALLQGIKFSAEGKSFVLNFEMPKEDAHKLIDKKLQEARQKKQQSNVDGTTNESGANGR